MRSVLPVIPKLDDDELERSDRLHRDVHARIAGLEPELAQLVRRVVWRRLVEAAASAGAIEYDCAEPRLVLPPRRRFLPPGLVGRIDGTEAALVHIDSRLRMAETGQLDHPFDRETPMVLNAFIGSHDTRGTESNVGSIRVTPTGYLDDGADFVPPAPAYCRELLDETIDVVRSRPPVHHLELAAWTSLLMFAIHPFVDGNGRTARLVFQLLHSLGLAGRFDTSSIESWSTHRRRYIVAIQRATPVGPPNSVAHLDSGAFGAFALERSIEGAARTIARIEHVERAVASWRPVFGEATLTYAFVAFERNVPPAELAELGDRAHHVNVAEELRAAGHLVVDRLGRYDAAGARPSLKSPDAAADGMDA